MTKIKAGVIGLGVGEQHIYGYEKCDCEVIALCDKDAEKRQQAAIKFPRCKVYETAEEMIAAGEIDVVSIASFDQDHAPQILSALKQGMHVFSEKPLCLKESELDDIYAELASRPGLRLSTNTILRLSERFTEVKLKIDGGQLGELYYVEADYNYGRLHKLMSGWRGDISEYSVMLGGGVHMVDLLIWLAGSTVVEVQAYGNKFCSKGASFKTPDMVVALMRFENGVVGKVAANFGCVYPHFHKVSLYGTDGTFENARNGGELILSRDPNSEPFSLTSPYPGASKGDLIPSFIQAVQGQGDPIVSEKDVYSAVSACLAIDLSLSEGKSVKVKQYQDTLRKHA